MYVVGNVDTQAIIYKSGTYGGSNPPDSVILNTISGTYGSGSYDILAIDDDSNDAARLMANHDYSGIWSSGELTAVDFSLEDDKRLLKFVAMNASGEISLTFIADGSDYLNVYAYAFEPGTVGINMSGLDTTFSGTLEVPVYDPYGVLTYADIPMVSGAGMKQFSTTTYGTWQIPNCYNFDGQNIKVCDEQTYDIIAKLDI